MTTHTLTGDLATILGGELTSPYGLRAKAWIEPAGGVVTSGGDTMIGATPIPLDSSDTFSIVIPDGGYRVRVRYFDQGQRQMADEYVPNTGYFNFSANADLADFVTEDALLYVPVRGVTNHPTVTGAVAYDGTTDHELNLTGNTQVTLTGPVGVEIGLFVHFNGFTLTVNGTAVTADDPGTVVAKLWASEWRIYVSASISGGVLPASPNDIAGLQLWYDANAASALTLVSTKVSNWRNDGAIGSAGDLQQATDADRPLTTTVNGKTAVSCPDATRNLDRTSVGGGLDTLPATVWAVVKINANTAGNIAGGAHPTIKTTGVTGEVKGVSSTGAGVVITGAYAIGDVIFAALVVAASGPAKLWVGAASNSATITLDGGLFHWFGCSTQSDYCEMGCYDTALSDADIAALYAGLKAKWNTL